MKKIRVAQTDLEVSEIGLGIMRIDQLSNEQAKEVIQTAVDTGINFFDHADIYGGGESERIFGQAFSEMEIARDSVYIQSKTGIVPGKMYDFSKELYTLLHSG